MIERFAIRTVSVTDPEAWAALGGALRDTRFAVLTDQPVIPLRMEAV